MAGRMIAALYLLQARQDARSAAVLAMGEQARRLNAESRNDKFNREPERVQQTAPVAPEQGDAA